MIQVSTLTVKGNKKYYVHLFVDGNKHSCLGIGSTAKEAINRSLKTIPIVERVLVLAKSTLVNLLK